MLERFTENRHMLNMNNVRHDLTNVSATCVSLILAAKHVYDSTGAFVLVDMSMRSPQKTFILLKKSMHVGLKYLKNDDSRFENKIYGQ